MASFSSFGVPLFIDGGAGNHVIKGAEPAMTRSRAGLTTTF
jgi:hypothetical protein